jgi:hypothetical protein
LADIVVIIVINKNMARSIEFKAAGKQWRLTREQLIARLKGSHPGPLRTHVVAVGGITYSVKEAVAVATGLDPLDFNTNQARSWLRRLGFEVKRVVVSSGMKRRR